MMLDVNFWTKFFILLVGVGMGFCMALMASAKIVSENYDLKKQLEKITSERNLLLTINRQLTRGNPNVEVINLEPHRVEEPDYFTEF